MALIPAVKQTGEVVGTPEAIGTITVGGTTYTKYRIFLDCGALTNNGAISKSLGFTFNKIISITGVANNSTGFAYPLPYSHNTSEYVINMYVKNGNAIDVVTYNSVHTTQWTGFSATVEIEYY